MKTQKVAQSKVAASKLVERASRAASAKRAADYKSLQAFVDRQEELSRLLNAFVDRLSFLPSVPSTDTT